MHTYLYTYLYIHIYIFTGLEISGVAWRITFGVIANHCAKVIRQILLALRITFGRLRITFQMDSPKHFFCPHSLFR